MGEVCAGEGGIQADSQARVSVDGMFTWIRSKRGRIGLERETRWLWSKAY